MTVSRMIVLIYPSEAMGLIADLGRGEPTEQGDRTSRYIDIAKWYGEKITKTVKIALVEEKAGLPCSEWGYALHIINDVDMANCEMCRTEHLSAGELEALLGRILNALEHGEELPTN